MSINGTLGSLLQGVSQQPPAVRPDGKVSEQINFISDVVQGLTSRPALKHYHTSAPTTQLDLKQQEIEIDGETYILGYTDSFINIRRLDGTAMNLIVSAVGGEPNPLDYIGRNMRFFVFDDKLYLANRDVVVVTDSTIDTSAVLQDVGYVSVLGGVYSRMYTVSVTYDDGTTAVGAYETPDGTTSGDADMTTSSHIAEQIATSLAADINWKAGSMVERQDSILKITSASGAISVRVDDDNDQTALRQHTDTAEKIEDLAKTAAHGTLVRITGNDEGNEDDFYLRFNAKTTDVVGQGFGSDGVWEEWVNPNEVLAFDLSSMPHVLEKTDVDEFTLSTGNWLPRRVGDTAGNPFPDIVGHPIRDIGGFQSRLVLVGGPWCVMSRSNAPTDFFKKSALTELSTDPISMSSTQEGTVRLDWIIPFDRDLVLMSDPGTGQYIISGNGKLTPQNASLVSTTAFEMRGGAKPVETGRTILFPFKSGKFSGIKEFFTNDEVATNGADTVTETLDRYIVGLVDRMECSTNFNMAVFASDEAEYANTVWVYKYLWQNTEKLQSSWSKWTFPAEVVHYFFKGSELFVVLREEAATDPAQVYYVTAALDLDIPVDDGIDYHICLDYKQQATANASGEAVFQMGKVDTAPRMTYFVQGAGCATPGRAVAATGEIGPDANGYITYTFDTETVPDGAEVFAGFKYTRSVTPTRPYVRDRNGNPAARTALVIGSYILEYEETGYIKAIMYSRYRQDPIEFVMDWFPMDNDPADPLGNGLRSGKLNIPWGERGDWSELTLTSDDTRPTTIIEIEWTGQVFKGTRG